MGFFSLIWRRHHCRWRAASFDLYSAPMAFEQYGFCSMPHLKLLWHRTSIYNGHLREPMIHTSITERFAVVFLRLTCRSVAAGNRTYNLLHAYVISNKYLVNMRILIPRYFHNKENHNLISASLLIIDIIHTQIVGSVKRILPCPSTSKLTQESWNL